MEVLSEHLCEGWLEGYLLTGRHGLFATYEAFAMVSASMTVQHTKWLQEAVNLLADGALTGANRVINVLAQRPHNGFQPGSRPDRRHALPTGHGRVSICRPTPTACSRSRPLPAQPQLRQSHRDRQTAQLILQ